MTCRSRCCQIRVSAALQDQPVAPQRMAPQGRGGHSGTGMILGSRGACARHVVFANRWHLRGGWHPFWRSSSPCRSSIPRTARGASSFHKAASRPGLPGPVPSASARPPREPPQHWWHCGGGPLGTSPVCRHFSRFLRATHARELLRRAAEGRAVFARCFSPHILGVSTSLIAASRLKGFNSTPLLYLRFVHKPDSCQAPSVLETPSSRRRGCTLPNV